MEYMYQLNLPSFFESKLDNFSIDDCFKDNLIQNISPEKFLKPEFLKIKNLDWNRSLSFKKPPNTFKAKIHIDNINFEESEIVWGINWIVGYGGMKYWHREQIDSYSIAIDSNKNYRTDIVTTQPCY